MNCIRTLAFVAIAAGLVASAIAADATNEASGPCKDDAAKLCPDVKPGQGRIMACLKEHKADVSEGCKKAAAMHRGQRRAAKHDAAASGAGQ